MFRTTKPMLQDFVEAQKFMCAVLTRRLEDYEQRMKLPKYKQLIEYLNTFYGKTGYLRTKKILAAINNPAVQTTQDLLRIAMQEEYHKGPNLSMLLKLLVLRMSGCTEQDTKIVEYNIANSDINIAITQPDLPQFNDNEAQAISYLYYQIKNSTDYGCEFISDLRRNINHYSNAVEMDDIRFNL